MKQTIVKSNSLLNVTIVVLAVCFFGPAVACMFVSSLTTMAKILAPIAGIGLLIVIVIVVVRRYYTRF